MECLNIKIDEKDEFISRLINQDTSILQFYDYDPNSTKSFEKRMDHPNNGREKEVARVIREYMSDLNLTSEQKRALDALENGAKVVIGGQQAVLFTGPLYTFHKIISMIVKANELEASFHQPVVPVFWIAGEDHDFDEVNHTYVMREREGTLEKVKYHTLEPPETSVSHYYPDKEELQNVLKQYFKMLPETSHSKVLYTQLMEMIELSEKWTDLFKMLIHECFKSKGILLIDAQYDALREIEKPIFHQLIQKRDQVDRAFREMQNQTAQQGLPRMIETDSNTHLFLEADQQRQLLKFDEGVFKLSKSKDNYTAEELYRLIEEEPYRFSNNVVTRPLMQEWLFNTVAFVGGPSEIKYWAELKGVFHLFGIEMPIVLPRMRMTYVTSKARKLLSDYQVSPSKIILDGIDDVKEAFIRAKASDQVLDDIDQMIEQQQKFYTKLKNNMSDSEDNERLLQKNNQIQLHQYRYLKERYLRNIERENEISMRHFTQLTQTLHPMGGLQERIWNPLQLLNQFGMHLFVSSTFPPLRYTFNQIVIQM
ncbi:bacillithiol biosynthesis cysteine-adding enzyme BshC [Staphylococcus felis]|uniref:bacillithiol biosynthesis cysteine-adding enzyme BshC n=1 Tax=Staphylococcus felis TaxID=46127 RepID=UPI000E26D3AA|nr:bacillithiol biosynthesis cysteine-adding enzyme BshC [Staphylococcus felis]REI07288.1 bacillithiol biosynthesis cysteine-adding enzyme BshC [Staphylococcus felis]